MIRIELAGHELCWGFVLMFWWCTSPKLIILIGGGGLGMKCPPHQLHSSTLPADYAQLKTLDVFVIVHCKITDL